MFITVQGELTVHEPNTEIHQLSPKEKKISVITKKNFTLRKYVITHVDVMHTKAENIFRHFIFYN